MAHNSITQNPEKSMAEIRAELKAEIMAEFKAKAAEQGHLAGLTVSLLAVRAEQDGLDATKRSIAAENKKLRTSEISQDILRAKLADLEVAAEKSTQKLGAGPDPVAIEAEIADFKAVLSASPQEATDVSNCKVCWEKTVDKVLDCGHTSCDDCAQKMFPNKRDKANKCPTCREPAGAVKSLYL
jgi:septal ring factor EnvC (AmiA/AmiB activator)